MTAEKMCTGDLIMKNNFDLEKSRCAFEKSLEDIRTVYNITKPYSAVSQSAILGLFERCCDCSYIFLKDILSYHGYFLPVTSSPKMLAEFALDCGLIGDGDLWLDIFETRNLLAHTYDEKDIQLALNKCKEKYIPAFERLKQSIDENWLNT